MFDRIDIVAAALLGAGLVAGAAAEYLVRCVRSLRPLRFVAFALFAAVGLYAAGLALQRGHIAPATHRGFVAVVIVLATVVAARISGRMVGRHGGDAARTIGSISLFVSVSETIVAIVGGLVVMEYLGVSVAPILTAFGIGGLAVALALQDTLANFFSGIQIAASRQVHAGDYVRLDADNAGTIVDINWRNTVIRDADGNRIIVPNQKLATAIFTNFRMPLRVPVTVTVDRNADVAALAQLAQQTAQSVTGNLTSEQIGVHFEKLSDANIDMVVMLPAKDAADRRRAYSEFVKDFLGRARRDEKTAPKIKAVAR